MHRLPVHKEDMNFYYRKSKCAIKSVLEDFSFLDINKMIQYIYDDKHFLYSIPIFLPKTKNKEAN